MTISTNAKRASLAALAAGLSAAALLGVSQAGASTTMAYCTSDDCTYINGSEYLEGWCGNPPGNANYDCACWTLMEGEPVPQKQNACRLF